MYEVGSVATHRSSKQHVLSLEYAVYVKSSWGKKAHKLCFVEEPDKAGWMCSTLSHPRDICVSLFACES